jgi:purine catabolism regulator
MNEFQGAQVVAGFGGLNKTVSWVHVVGVPDAANWLNGGELVLTTGINMPNDAVDQIRYMQALAEKGVTALALAVGRYIDHAPQHMRAVADSNNFPLIEVPFQARFVDIARRVNERISQENLALLERTLTIHRVLTQVVLEGGELKDLAEKLAGLVGHSISIETEQFEALANANIAAFDEARRYTMEHGRTNPTLIHALEDRGYLNEIRQTRRPVFIPQIPEVGLEMERILAPVVVHGDIYGYMWIIADDRPINDLDRVAIETGATIAAVILLHQEAALVAEASLKGGLLSQLIRRDLGRESVLTDQALRYGLDLNMDFVALLLDNEDRSSQNLLRHYRRANRLAGTNDWRAVVGQFAGRLVLIVQSSEDITQVTQGLVEEGDDLVRIGVSALHSGAETVAQAHEQCLDTIRIMRRLAPDEPVVYFEDLGYLYPLYRSGHDSLEYNPFVPGLRKLVGEQQADLFHTLEVFLDAGGNGVRTADLLTIHRSTLNYRLDRIQKICKVTLSDPVTRTNLQMALKLLRLFEVE